MRGLEVFLIVVFCLVGCASPTTDEENQEEVDNDASVSDTPQQCANSCERALWLNLIVGYVDLQGGGSPEEYTLVLKQDDDESEGNEGGCPNLLPDHYDCWYSFWVADTGEEATLTVEFGGESRSVDIDPSVLQSRCAQAIGYVRVVNEEDGVRVDDKEVIAPCDEDSGLPVD